MPSPTPRSNRPGKVYFREQRVGDLADVGKQFGRWTVIDAALRERGKPFRLICQCECGTVRAVTQASLRNGASQSCGCLNLEIIQTQKGRSKDPLFITWRNIRERCTSSKSHAWGAYGGRGIRIAPEWENDADAFIAYVVHALGPRPTKRHSLDRVNNDGHYEPGNLRWATYAQQARNRRPVVRRRPQVEELMAARLTLLDRRALDAVVMAGEKLAA